MRRRRGPRRLGRALERAAAEAAPATLLAAVQRAWLGAVGEVVAAEAEPVAEREGVITVACRTASWAQELDLMQDEIVARLVPEVGSDRIRRLRFTADAARHRPDSEPGRGISDEPDPQ